MTLRVVNFRRNQEFGVSVNIDLSVGNYWKYLNHFSDETVYFYSLIDDLSKEQSWFVYPVNHYLVRPLRLSRLVSDIIKFLESVKERVED
jgi:hypothetical protein